MGLLEEYIGFIRSVNGLLGTIINFFPLSAVLLGFIPEFSQTGGQNKVLTSINCIFVIYVSFIFAYLIKRHFKWYEYGDYGWLGNIRHIAVILFCSIICISGVLILFNGISGLNRIIDCVESNCPYLEDLQDKLGYLYTTHITSITYGFSAFNLMNFVFLYKSENE